MAGMSLWGDDFNVTPEPQKHKKIIEKAAKPQKVKTTTEKEGSFCRESEYAKTRYYLEQEVEEGELVDLKELDSFYQLLTIKNINYEVVTDTMIRFLESGTAQISYYRYPQRIDEKTPDTYEFE